MEKDSRNFINRENINKEKWIRNIKLQEEYAISKNNLIANPTNYKQRNRSESPPSKRYRNNRGINKGTNPGCSYCRPEIGKRMFNVCYINKEIRQFLL